MSRAKIIEAETPSQADHWQRFNSAALRLGLCHRCAAQHAYGRQHGWQQVHPPCTHCEVLAVEHAPAWAAAHGISNSGGESDLTGAPGGAPPPCSAARSNAREGVAA